jgi:hypothetical protein
VGTGRDNIHIPRSLYEDHSQPKSLHIELSLSNALSIKYKSLTKGENKLNPFLVSLAITKSLSLD